ncbi:hypothetical protein PG987_005431, partial [Apiospora arundinis]
QFPNTENSYASMGVRITSWNGKPGLNLSILGETLLMCFHDSERHQVRKHDVVARLQLKTFVSDCRTGTLFRTSHGEKIAHLSICSTYYKPTL